MRKSIILTVLIASLIAIALGVSSTELGTYFLDLIRLCATTIFSWFKALIETFRDVLMQSLGSI